MYLTQSRITQVLTLPGILLHAFTGLEQHQPHIQRNRNMVVVSTRMRCEKKTSHSFAHTLTHYTAERVLIKTPLQKKGGSQALRNDDENKSLTSAMREKPPPIHPSLPLSFELHALIVSSNSQMGMCVLWFVQTAWAGVSFSATIATPRPRSGDDRTRASCRRALRKSLTARIRMNHPTIMRP